MNLLVKFSTAAALSVGMAVGAFAADANKGTVKKIDMKAGKVTISHGELHLASGGDAMPAMTMVFRVADDAMLEKLKEGQSIEFLADRVKGKLTVTELK